MYKHELEFGVVYLCRAKTEEARIIAWENLQRAKAEAEIRKLEVLFFLLVAFLFFLFPLKQKVIIKCVRECYY